MQNYRGLVSLAATGWIQLPKEFFKITRSTEGAILLAWMINEASMIQEQRPQDMEEQNDWFRFSARKIQETLCISKNTQVRAVKELVELGFIEEDRRGIPARRWVLICPEVIQKALENLQSARNGTTSRPDSQLSRKGTTVGPESGQLSIYQKKLLKNSPEPGVPESERTDSRQDAEDKEDKKKRCKERAEKLYGGISKHQRVNKNWKLQKWQDAFQSLENGYDRKVVDDVLNWFLRVLPDRFSDKFFPRVLSAQAFKDKFDRLLALYEDENGRDGIASEPDPQSYNGPTEVCEARWARQDADEDEEW